MQVDGEPWRQPIPAAPDALRGRRPSFLQQPQGGGAKAQPAAAARPAQQQQQPVVLRVSHAGHSQMLFNDRDPQVTPRLPRHANMRSPACVAVAWLAASTGTVHAGASIHRRAWPWPHPSCRSLTTAGHPPGAQDGGAGRRPQPGAGLRAEHPAQQPADAAGGAAAEVGSITAAVRAERCLQKWSARKGAASCVWLHAGVEAHPLRAPLTPLSLLA